MERCALALVPAGVAAALHANMNGMGAVVATTTLTIRTIATAAVSSFVSHVPAASVLSINSTPTNLGRPACNDSEVLQRHLSWEIVNKPYDPVVKQ